MFSFIVIGKNEAKNLKKCFDSVFQTIQANLLNNYEVLYVDSNSNDNSIDIAKRFEEIKIFRLTEFCSPAVARNVGAKEATGKILFFVDGDTFINPDFVNINKLLKQSRPYIYGSYYDVTDKAFEKFDNNKTLAKKTIWHMPFHGGIFIIAKDLFVSVNGFNEKYKKAGGEDIDLSLRLKKHGHIAKYKNNIIAYHYTIDYLDPARMWKMLSNGSQLFARSVLYRDHFLCKDLMKIFLRREYSTIALLISLAACIVLKSPLPALLYITTIITRIILQKNKKGKDVLHRFIYYTVRDIYVIIGFLFFYPKKPKNINYERIQ